MTHSYRGFLGICHKGNSRQFCQQDRVYISRCDFDNRQQFTFVDLRGDEFLIRVPLKNQCFERRGPEIYLEPCDSSNSRQRFYFRHGGEGRFSLSQRDTGLCVTNRHHPKAAELVRMENCGQAYDDATLYWEKY